MMGRTGLPPEFVLFPPTVAGDLLLIQHLYRSYRQGPDDEFSNWWDFRREIGSGHIVTGAVAIDGNTVAMFGVELMTRPGPWINVLFYNGLMNRALMREMVSKLYSMLQIYKTECGLPGERGAVRILGRSGWRRVAAGMGIEMDRRGFVFDDQKGLRNGYLRRFQ